jgi:hypothetical protein
MDHRIDDPLRPTIPSGPGPSPVNVDVKSERLGIVKGGMYPMRLFHAVRRITGAALHIEVAAADFAVCDGGPQRRTG